MKILAVDDDQFVLVLLGACLRAGGYSEYKLVDSGSAALTEITSATTPYECILLDIQMPEMDGIELCSAIRSLPDYGSCPIIMITAMTERSYIDEAFSAGATDYVSKPFDPLELGTRIRLAETLVSEQRIALDKSSELHSLKSKLDEAFRFSIDDPIVINEVPGVIDKLVMENYLLQLSRSRVYNSTGIGFAIADFEDFWIGTTLGNIYYTLIDVADAITLNLKKTGYLLAYCGRGRFVCVTERGAVMDIEELEQSIQDTIDDFDVMSDNRVRIVVGEPRTTSLWGSLNPLQLMDDAIAAIDPKCRNGQSAPADSRSSKKFDRIVGFG
ncbi:response regulator [Aliiroseovarius sp. YM-037]|uniref:response regulator n=1 Tax=Aliiroseovarius sp. YM-037 TaxID=3341728 RepID=UPI003A7F64CD